MQQRTAALARAIALACLLAATCAAAPGAGAVAARQPPRPNVVLIVADDLGWNGVGYHGGFVQTPHIDRIARQGVELDHFYVSPMCSPTRAGLMTGRYPMRYGMARSVVRPWARFGLPPAERTLPEALAAAGYRHRGAFGKWHMGHLGPQWHPLSQGFTEFKGHYNGAGDYWTHRREGELDWHAGGEPLEEKGYNTDLIGDAACAFIRKHAAEGPLFCYVPFMAPHEPLQAPDAYLARYAHLGSDPAKGKPSDLQLLAAMISCMDDNVGKILKTVEEAGIAGRTMIWFTSDNGGIGRFPQNNRPLRAAKLTVYEGGVRVPAAVWWPGVIEGGRKIAPRLTNLDVLPTVCRAAGADANGPAPLDGADAFDVLAGKKTTMPGRDLYFFTGQSGPENEQLAVISGDEWKLVVIGPDVRREGGYRTPQHRVELFRLKDDPGEQTDLAAKHPDLVQQLGDKLVVFRESEPEDALAPANRRPKNFKPPPQWRNAPAAQPAGAGG